MKIAFYGSSLLSSYWNGAATYYRGLLKALAAHGHAISFYEPDAFDRQSHRDIDPPPWCRSVVYRASEAGLRSAAAEAAQADVVIKASGVGYGDEALPGLLLAARRGDAVAVFWDVDAPATLAELRTQPTNPLRTVLGSFDLVLTYGGGEPVVRAYEGLGARLCRPVYNALDPQTHHPVAPQARYAADLVFLGNRLPDREARVHRYFFDAASRAPRRQFLLGGAGWDAATVPRNVEVVGHVPTADHNVLNVSSRLVLNVSRESMAENGWSPATRVFEAAGAGACIVTDAWEGLEAFLTPGLEILVARDGRDVAAMVESIDVQEARTIGRRALARVLADHTYDRRAVEVDTILQQALARRRATEDAA
ncbi:CgeB family protein [Alsobacter sp. R-9]